MPKGPSLTGGQGTPFSLPTRNESGEGGKSSSTKKKLVLDLFSGTQSVGKIMRAKGYQVLTVDWNKRSKPDFVVDVLTWNYKDFLKPGTFELVAASVPCNEYSQAKKVGVRDLEYADRLVKRTLEIIEYLKPTKWWIENPRNGLLRTRQLLDGYPYVDVDYCQFSDWGYNKPTRFWGSPNVVGKESRVCDHQTCPNLVDGPCGRKRHKYRLGGLKMKFSTKQKGRIPEAVIEYLVEECVAPGPVRQASEGESQFEDSVVVSSRLLWPSKAYNVGSCTSKAENTQLVMEIPVRMANGEILVMKALIDTGAEANLVRTGFFPRHMFFGAEKPLKLVTASGHRMEGGDRTIDTQLEFSAYTSESQALGQIILGAKFYEAAIQVDAILAYPWLRENEIGVFPHKKALAMDFPELILLFGLVSRGRSSPRRGKGVHSIQVNPASGSVCPNTLPPGGGGYPIGGKFWPRTRRASGPPGGGGCPVGGRKKCANCGASGPPGGGSTNWHRSEKFTKKK